MERTFTARTDLDAILLEQALAMARELAVASDAAPDGQVLAVAEMAALRAGRELTRRALEATLQRQADAAEGKGLRPGLPPRRPSPGQGRGAQGRGDRRRAGRAHPPVTPLPAMRADGLSPMPVR